MVSVVIPCRNAALTLAATLDSVLAQTHSHLEVLVVDDGSTDGSAECVRARNDPRLRLIEQGPRGACAARNKGLAAATGSLVQFLDADDLLAPDKIAAQVALWQQHGDDMVYACAYGRFATHIGDGTPQPLQARARAEPVQWFIDSALTGTMLPPHAWLVPMPLCRRAGLWNESLLQNQDGEYFLRVLSAATRVEYLAETLCHYRCGRPDSISNQHNLAARASRLASFDLIAQTLLTQATAARAQKAMAALYMTLAIDCAVDHPELAQQAAAKAFGCARWPPITGRGSAFRTAAALLGWQRTARLAALRKRLTSQYRTG